VHSYEPGEGAATVHSVTLSIAFAFLLTLLPLEHSHVVDVDVRVKLLELGLVLGHGVGPVLRLLVMLVPRPSTSVTTRGDRRGGPDPVSGRGPGHGSGGSSVHDEVVMKWSGRPAGSGSSSLLALATRTPTTSTMTMTTESFAPELLPVLCVGTDARRRRRRRRDDGRRSTLMSSIGYTTTTTGATVVQVQDQVLLPLDRGNRWRGRRDGFSHWFRDGIGDDGSHCGSGSLWFGWSFDSMIRRRQLDCLPIADHCCRCRRRRRLVGRTTAVLPDGILTVRLLGTLSPPLSQLRPLVRRFLTVTVGEHLTLTGDGGLVDRHPDSSDSLSPMR